MAEVGRRLRATVRGEDAVARMGGGAFAVLAHGEDADADRLASRCLSVVEQPIMTTAGLIELTAGVGARARSRRVGVEDLLARADLAVRAAHDGGPGLAPAATPRPRRRGRPAGPAAAATCRARAPRDELFLLFQPIVSLERAADHRLEAQLRWRHPELGEIPPAEFLPLAERAGLIGELVRWALEEATAATAGLPEGGAAAARRPQGAGRLRRRPARSSPTSSTALRRSGLAPERLVLQIERVRRSTADDERIGLDIASLRLMGVHVALDGFGSGSSALAHLTRLPIDIVKLDRSLITRIDRDPQSRALCESIIGIGRALGLDVVAEGVETPAQLAALRGFGCGFAQGFLIARPMPLVRLHRAVRRRRRGRSGRAWSAGSR